jgi:hypothetical protein
LLCSFHDHPLLLYHPAQALSAELAGAVLGGDGFGANWLSLQCRVIRRTLLEQVPPTALSTADMRLHQRILAPPVPGDPALSAGVEIASGLSLGRCAPFLSLPVISFSPTFRIIPFLPPPDASAFTDAASMAESSSFAFGAHISSRQACTGGAGSGSTSSALSSAGTTSSTSTSDGLSPPSSRDSFYGDSSALSVAAQSFLRDLPDLRYVLC